MADSLYEKVLKARLLIDDTVKSNPEGAVGVASAFGRTSLALLHLVGRTGHRLPVFFADTGCHHPELIAFKEAFQRDSNLELVEVQSELDFARFHATPLEGQPPQGSGLTPHHNMEACCRALKIDPLVAAFKARGLTACLVGAREQKAHRCGDEPHFRLLAEVTTVAPLAAFTDQDLDDYVQEYRLPTPDLYRQGYLALACLPCTPQPRRRWSLSWRRKAAGGSRQSGAEAEAAADEQRLKRRLEDLGYM